MPTWVGWALAAVVLLGVTVVLMWRLRKRPSDVLKAGVALIAKARAEQIKHTQRRIAKLDEDFIANEAKILKLEDQLYEQRRKLEGNFKSQGLSSKEVADAFSKLGF